MTLRGIEEKANEIRHKRVALKEQYETQLKELEGELRHLDHQRAVIMTGYDPVRIRSADMVLDVRGLRNGYYDQSVVNDAKADLLDGCKTMREKYFGSKHYDRWEYQREDHKYGYSPNYGCVVFSIGLRNPKGFPTESEIEDCLYLLNAMENPNFREAMKA